MTRESRPMRREVHKNKTPQKSILSIILLLILSSCNCETYEDRATNAARNILLDSLKSPSTVQWAGDLLVEKSHPYYLRFFTIDAQNSFGAMIRSHFLVCVKIEDEKEIPCSSPDAVQEYNHYPLSIEVEVFKKMNSWPDENDELGSRPSNEDDNNKTALSKKASMLKFKLTKKEVIRLLGPATWAVIPGDTGDFTLPGKTFGLVLYWKNDPCTPVIVDFNIDFRVTGWDEGWAICGEEAQYFGPSDDYSCSKPDRSSYCK